jgi:hypothetical protein
MTSIQKRPQVIRDLIELATYSQLSNIQLQISKSQPIPSSDMLQLLERAIVRIQARIPALERSIEEVKIEYNLP